MPKKCSIMLAIAVVLMSGCSGTRPTHIGIQPGGKLAACPDTPNCVTSFASVDDKRHYIEPIEADADKWRKLPRILAETPRITVMEQDENYLKAEATTRIWRFVDDLEFLYDPTQSLIHVRSASRIGRSDFGVNRKRIEQIRKQLDDQ